MKEHKTVHVDSIIKEIADQNDVSPETVYNEISIAISEALKSDDPLIQEFWKSIPCEGDAPSVEETIAFLANHVKKHNER